MGVPRQRTVATPRGPQPDLWHRDYAAAIEQRIEMGLPDEARIMMGLSRLAERTMRPSCTIQDGHAPVSCDRGAVNVEPVKWLARERMKTPPEGGASF